MLLLFFLFCLLFVGKLKDAGVHVLRLTPMMPLLLARYVHVLYYMWRAHDMPPFDLFKLFCALTLSLRVFVWERVSECFVLNLYQMLCSFVYSYSIHLLSSSSSLSFIIIIVGGPFLFYNFYLYSYVYRWNKREQIVYISLVVWCVNV